MPQTGKVEILAMGGDVRFAASRLVTDWNPNRSRAIPVGQLEQFTDKLLNMSEDAIVRRYHLSFPEAETVGPALLTYMQLAEAYGLDTVLVANINLRDGLLKEMAAQGHLDGGVQQPDHPFGARSRPQVSLRRTPRPAGRRSCRGGCSKPLRDEHQLDHRHEIILYVAALLHEIGLYVSQQSHHKHSMYLIKNSELFGLSRKDVLLAALVARYYRRASPAAESRGLRDACSRRAGGGRQDGGAAARGRGLGRQPQPANQGVRLHAGSRPAGHHGAARQGSVARTAGPAAKRVVVRGDVRRAGAAAHPTRRVRDVTATPLPEWRSGVC